MGGAVATMVWWVMGQLKDPREVDAGATAAERGGGKLGIRSSVQCSSLNVYEGTQRPAEVGTLARGVFGGSQGRSSQPMTTLVEGKPARSDLDAHLVSWKPNSTHGGEGPAAVRAARRSAAAPGIQRCDGARGHRRATGRRT